MHHPVRAHRAHRAHRALATLAGLVSIIGSACAAGPSPADEPVAIGGRVVAGGFVLEVRLPTQTFAPTDSIPVITTLTWTGAPGAGRIWGSGSGPVSFMFTEVGGAGRTMGGAMTADCTMTEFAPGVPTAIPLGKSGGWTGDDPNAAFYQAWYKDPALHLPTGHWQLRVAVGGFLVPCEMGAPTIEASIGPIDILIR